MNKPAGKIEAAKKEPAKAKPAAANDALPSIYERLAAEFPREAIHWRALTMAQSGNKALAVGYMDARDVQDRLDQVCTPAGWRDSYTETPKGRVIATIEILIDGQWIGKSDGAGDTAVEGAKGGMSDAFKRAAVKWGIGRYLYRLPSVWAPCESTEKPQGSGKRYFKNWLRSPWDRIPADWKANTYQDDPGETETAVAVEAKGIEGISGIKKRLGELRIAGDKATDLDEFNKLVRAHADDLQAIKDDNHDWWAGDGIDDEGFKAWILRRRNKLSPGSLSFQMLVSALEECATKGDLADLIDRHGSVAEMLDGEESRRWVEAYNAREAAIMAVAPVSAG